MSHTVAVMNAKGGVGKSTVVMALAETLSVFHGKNVLVIDSDSQTSMSIMVMHMSRWEELEKAKRTLVDYLAAVTLGGSGSAVDWRSFVASRVSDVDEAETIYLVPSHMELSLFEREISERGLQKQLAVAVRGLLDDAKRYFDIVLVDCPPGISILTEAWLRECDFYMPPTKADYLSVRGLAIIERYRDLAPGRRFARNLGVVINQKDGRIRAEEEWHQWLLSDPKNLCFRHAIPRRAYIQRAADFDPGMRTFAAKYPGDAGEAVRALATEFLERIEGFTIGAEADTPPTDAVASGAHQSLGEHQSPGLAAETMEVADAGQNDAADRLSPMGEGAAAARSDPDAKSSPAAHQPTEDVAEAISQATDLVAAQPPVDAPPTAARQA